MTELLTPTASATAPPAPARRSHPAALRALKTVHTLIWFSVESSVAYLLYSGATRRSNRRAAIAGTVVAAESLIFLANGARCPLSGLAAPLGGESASVTDIYLPKWLAHNLPVLHVPLIIAAVALHTRNLRQRHQHGRQR